MQYKIVADSSSDVRGLSRVPFASAPLKITVGETTYVDDSNLDVAGLVQTLRTHKGRSITACPSPEDWLECFGDAEYVFCVAITSTLSGSCNAARLAAQDYESAHPGRKVFVIDTLSAGPELALIVEKLEEMICEGRGFETICHDIMAYLKKTKLTFMLQSVRNLANNGRVNPAVAALVGLLGIRIVGIASDHGDLQQMAKSRGDKRGMADMLKIMKDLGYKGGKVLIHHCENLPAAEAFKNKLLEFAPAAKVVIDTTAGLCSYYAEDGGMLVGFETA